jgi:hypothetical protein
MTGSSRTLRTLAPLVAFLAAVAFLVLPRRLFGRRASEWNVLRRRVFPILDSLKRDHTDGYAMYSLDKAELVAEVDASVEAVGAQLAREGYTRMPLSALKRDHTADLIEAASWSTRESLFAPDQTHVMLFETDEGTRVYAHHERNAYAPRYAYEHYRGIGQDFEKGKRLARADLGALV